MVEIFAPEPLKPPFREQRQRKGATKLERAHNAVASPPLANPSGVLTKSEFT